MTATLSTKKALANGLLIFASFAIVLILAELLLRLRYAEPIRSATPEVLAIQRHLRLHPKIGFTWNPNVGPEQNIVLEVSDAESPPLSTDEYGFINPAEAIAERNKGTAIDLIGLGDSFMEHAAHDFYRYFKSNGLSYYGMAVHRQSPPQYNTILEEHALPLKPKWIVYGLFENDFAETEDYNDWKRSGLDWFTFHSGTWCGRPLAANGLLRFVDDHLRGFTGFAHVLHSRLRGEGMSVLGPPDSSIRAVNDEIVRAYAATRNSRANFLLVLIPSRATITLGPTGESDAYDLYMKIFERYDMPVLDLRDVFLRQDDPASLYYEIDAHWNARGIAIAAEAILEGMRRIEEANTR